MALKPDRIESHTDISFFMNAVAERGVVVVAATGTASSNVGASMDDAGALAEVAATATSRNPLGVLLNDVKDYDLTKQHINWYKDEVQKGGKVTILRQGQVTTDQLVSGDAPKAGMPAHLADDGELTVTTTNAKVGQFLGGVDAEGFVKVDINIS